MNALQLSSHVKLHCDIYYIQVDVYIQQKEV